MTILGLEHEYEVRRDGRPIDFRALIADVAASGCRLDPVDPYAHRMPDGSVLTCDGAEAETAAPPIELRPGFTEQLTTWAATMLDPLTGYDLHGVSTHISVEVRDDLTLLACGLFARRFAPALMLLGDGPQGLGLLVRPLSSAGRALPRLHRWPVAPRRNCVGVGWGARMRGRRRRPRCPPRSATSCERPIRRRSRPVRLVRRSPRVRRRPVRPGKGRAASHRRGTPPASTAAARSRMAGRERPARSLGARVSLGPRRCRSPGSGDDPAAFAVQAGSASGDDAPRFVIDAAPTCGSPLPSGLRRRAGRSDVGLHGLRRRGTRTLYLSVPRVEHDQFFGDLTAGRLDGGLARALSLPTAGRVLSTYADAHRGGQFDEVRLGALRVPEPRL